MITYTLVGRSTYFDDQTAYNLHVIGNNDMNHLCSFRNATGA